MVRKVADIVYTDRLEEGLEATAFQSIEYTAPPGFTNYWVIDGLVMTFHWLEKVVLLLSQGKRRIHKELSNWSWFVSVAICSI